MTARFRRALHAIVLCLIATSAQAADRPDYRDFTAAAYLPFLNAGEGPRLRTPAIGISFPDGRMHTATLDTGSTGVVVAASMIPGFERLRSRGEGRLTYTSSGRVMLGRWVLTPLTLHGRDGATARIERMPVLAVTRVACLRQARNCTPSDAPRNIAMVGIGFGREADAQAQSTPDKNPFLHLAHEGRAYRPGYVLTPHGAHVGLTEANTRGEFRFRKLAHNEANGDWQQIPACLRVDDHVPAACGTLLMDTGVTTMYLTLPSTQARGGRTLPPGARLAVDLGTAGDATPLYEFRAGARGERMAPDAIVLKVDDRKPPFVNTTVHFLAGYDYLYDFDGGYVGFRRH
ncbi:MAG: hypothetical protein U1F48_14860 [Burkholderiales bacterium]